MKDSQKYILLTIICLAVFFRFFQISLMPGGLFPDEAANGLDINLMQQGHLQPFYERGNGREALFFYLIWASVELFGKGPWQHHIVSALIGVLSVLMCFLLTRKLFSVADLNTENEQKNSTNIALLAAFLIAVSSWHVVLSRTAFRAIQIPLFSSLTFYFLLRTFEEKNKKFLFGLLTGISFAAGFYTYIAFRIMVPILFMLLVWPLLAKIKKGELFQTFNYYKTSILGFVVAFLIVIFPLANYFSQHFDSFVGRAGQVSVINTNLYTVNGEQVSGMPSTGTVLSVVFEVLKTQLKGFFVQGDLNWRQNISGQPFLPALYSLFFGIGLLVVTWFMVRYFFAPSKTFLWKFFLLGGWFWGMLLPVITTAEGIPHGLRGIGVIPVVFVISAWALFNFVLYIIKLHKKLWQNAFYKEHDPMWMKESHFKTWGFNAINFGLKTIAVLFCATLILQTYFSYFVYAANSPENFYYFRSDLTTVSKYLTERCDKQHTYLILDKFSVQTTDYLTSNWHGNFTDKCNIPYKQVDPENAWQLSNLTTNDEIVFTQSTMFDTKKFKQYHPNFHLALEYRNKFGQNILSVYKIKLGDFKQK